MMARFSDPDLFLLERWTDARLLEEAMKVVVTKFEEVVDAVLMDFQHKHPECDCPKKWFNRGNGTEFGIGRDAWPKSPYGSPSGFWIGCGLDSLTSSDSTRAWKSIWIAHPGRNDVEGKLRQEAGKLLSNQQSNRWEIESSNKETSIWCYLESREELFALLTKNDSRGLVDRMVLHLESMARFISVIDEIAGKRSRK